MTESVITFFNNKGDVGKTTLVYVSPFCDHSCRAIELQVMGATGPIDFAPVTVFFGGNSSGKTSLLQSLLLLKQTTDSADRGRVFDLGGPASLVR